MGLFARASTLARPGKSAGGLLRRGLAALQGLAAPAIQKTATAARPPAAAISAEEMSYRVAAIPAGLAAAPQLFALLKEALGLQQAALLAYDARRHVYSPLAAVGFDATSRHRLRLEPGANAEFNRAAAGEVVEVRGEELEAFRPYLSSRQYSAVKQLLLVPYLHAQRLVGLLVAARLSRPLLPDTLELLRAGMAPAGELLALEGQEPEAGDDGGGSEDRLRELLAECRARGQPLLLIRLSLEEPLRLAQERFPELEAFRLYESLVDSCRRLLRGIGRVEIPRPRTLVLLVHGMQDADPPLLLRQLESALLAELRGLVDAPRLDLAAEDLLASEEAQAQEFLRS